MLPHSPQMNIARRQVGPKGYKYTILCAGAETDKYKIYKIEAYISNKYFVVLELKENAVVSPLLWVVIDFILSETAKTNQFIRTQSSVPFSSLWEAEQMLPRGFSFGRSVRCSIVSTFVNMCGLFALIGKVK